jgi:hypothetical protein
MIPQAGRLYGSGRITGTFLTIGVLAEDSIGKPPRPAACAVTAGSAAGHREFGTTWAVAVCAAALHAEQRIAELERAPGPLEV